MTPDALLALRAALAVAGEPPEDEWHQFAELFRERTLERKQQLDTNAAAPTIAFVFRGLLRMYYTREDGRVFTKSFVTEGDFVAALDRLLRPSSAPSELSIEALESCTLLVAPAASVVAFFERGMFWQRFGRLHAEQLLARKLEREQQLLLSSARGRYEAFLDSQGALAQRLTDHHVASYLGITPEALSRLKAERARTPRG